MEELKFRLWESELEAMITNENSDQFLIALDGRVFDTGFESSNQGYCNDMMTVLQYTGLKDKNGVEIYKGDIIKSKCYPFYSDAPEMEGGKDEPVELNYLGVVGIDVNGVYYDLKVVSDRVSGRAIGGQLSELVDIEVVGNIYENPELIGEL